MLVLISACSGMNRSVLDAVRSELGVATAVSIMITP